MIAPANGLARIPNALGFSDAAPLLCAGVTTFNSLRHSRALPGDMVAVHGIGGVGHLGIQFARQFGFHVVAISRGKDKEELALRLGAHAYIDGGSTNAADPMAVSPAQLIGRRLGIQGWPSGSPKGSEDTLNFCALTGIRPMIEEFPLEDAARGY